MNILYYDCFSGISGDMNLAAMIDLGVSPEFLRAELGKLGLDHEFELRIDTGSRRGICGTRVDVVLKNQEAHHDREPLLQANTHAASPVGHDHSHTDIPEERDHRPADHVHDHGYPHHGDFPQGLHHHGSNRNLADIEAIIQGSGLDAAVKNTSLNIFRKVALAEARVHGKTLDEVHFHEVGATDSIVDIVGAAICFHVLGVDAVWASPVELGGGFVRCAHGCIPVPTPATVEILHGIPTTRGATKQETTTPTGAAILAALVDTFTDVPAMATEKTGYGIGHRDMDIPNVLRVHLVRPMPAVDAVRQARLLTCNIDDMTAEMLGATMDLLMELGAMDVHFTSIQMKKNRPGTCISLLCAVAEEERFKDLLFRHTTTSGVKSFPLEKTELERSFARLETPLGPVTMKNTLRDGKVLRAKPEFEDCRAMATCHNIPLAEVYACIARSSKEYVP